MLYRFGVVRPVTSGLTCRSHDLFLPFSDLQGVRTNAKKDGSDWILNGSKVGFYADLL